MKEVVIPEGKRLIGDNFILQQDNAPIHKAKKISEYLINNNINSLEWPPQSPDLSPIENVCSWMKLKVSERMPQSINDLKKKIKETWESFPTEECRNYTLLISDRISKMFLYIYGHCGY